MKKNTIIKNYLYNLIYQILVMILPLITTPYISRTLGAENIGIYSFTLSVSTYFLLFGSLGIVKYGQREIAYLQDNKKEYSKTFWEIVIFRFFTMIISMIFYYIIFIYNYNEYSIYYKILFVELIANCLDISWFFQGLEEFKKTVFRNLVIKIINVICIFIFVKGYNDLGIYITIYVISTLAGNISLWFYLPKLLTKTKIKELKIFRHFKPNIYLFIPQVAIQVYTVLDKVMLGYLIQDKSITGFYEQAQKIIKLLLTIITSLGTIMLSRVANCYANFKKEEIKNYLYKSFLFVYLLSFPMIFGIILISDSFVPLFFGNGFEDVALLMCVISPIILMIGLSSVIGTQFLLPTKKQKEYTISVIIGALANFIMNLLLIRKYGAIGASIGTVIAESIVTIIQFYYIRNTFDLKVIITSSIKYFISSLIMFIVCNVIKSLITNAIISIFVLVLVGIVIYIGMLYILNEKIIREIFNKIKKCLIKTRANG